MNRFTKIIINMRQYYLIIIVFLPLLVGAQENDLSSVNEFQFSSVLNPVNVGKHGLDTVKCEESLTIYNEFYKQKNYDSAAKSWLYLFQNAPKRTKNIYIHGATMYKNFIKSENDSLKRELLIDNLLSIYDQRNKFYPGQEGKVLGLKGSDLYKYRKTNISSLEQAYNILSESTSIDKEKSSARALNYYFVSAAKLTSKKILNKEDLIGLFSDVSTIIDYKEAEISQINFDLQQKESLNRKEEKIISNNVKELKTLNDVRANMEKTLAPHVTCDKLIALYEAKFEEKQIDFNWLERAAQLLKKGDCIDSEIYFKIAAKLYESNPTPKSAFYMGYLSLKQEDYSSAISYFTQAVTDEENNIKKADYLLYVAKTYAAMGMNNKAKKNALEAKNNRSGWGAPFILIGDLYAQTSRDCGQNTGNLTNDEFSKRVGYWAAIEKYQYAKMIDLSCAQESDQKIKKYINQAPDRTSTFQMIGLDQSMYKIECWYVETVKNPHFSE
ncbi:MAG: hypothetical protein CMP49_04945 [Flavobacteriales bacterium]|jgi:TolA-binding protein|nr:hypothetical protein [Flavobacteriales bacterium]|tara:strand:+ start:25109 stop:26602 length:1494 start_codon:yes stop_codon:yes gene_type:complete